MIEDGVMTSELSKVVAAICIGVFGLVGVGFSSAAAAGGSTASTSTVPVATNAFCYPAVRLVGTYSVNVEWTLGLNDELPLPNRMTPKIKVAVNALAAISLDLSRKASKAQMKAELHLLSVELKESKLPIDVVRAEAAFGATGYPALGLMCPSVTMIMTPTNPLGGFNSQ